MTHTLYGMPASLYTGKVRAYLRTQGIAYEERAASDPQFRGRIMPAVGRFIIPVVETPEGEILQDGAAIIDRFDERGLGTWTAHPDTPRHGIVTRIFELFGGEGLLRPAMHYRWNFDEQNLDFIRKEFGNALAAGATRADKDAAYERGAGRMRQAAMIFGVIPESFAEIEASYAEFLGLFAAHCEAHPYVLGGHPTAADYGLIAPLFAHLGRDPAPANLMRRAAPEVARWVERMNAPGRDAPEFPGYGEALFADDAIPETLLALLRYVARDFLGDLEAQVAGVDTHLAETEITEGDIVGGKPGQRMVGLSPLNWRGLSLNIGVFPYRIWLLQRVQDAFEALDDADRASVQAMLDDAGLGALLTLKPKRRVARKDHREVWGALNT